MSENNDLSERELEILRFVATGASNKEIAHKLYISTNTVKVHLRNIFTKIGVTSRTEAAMYAVNSGIVEGPFQMGNGQIGSNFAQSGSGAYAGADGSIFSGKIGRLTIGLLAFLVVGMAVASYWYWRNVTQRSSRLPSGLEAPSWQSLASMPTARYGLAAAAYENMIYTIGGEGVNGVTGVVERYDPVSDRWSERSPKPTKVTDVSAAVLGGKIYVPGGRLSSGEVTSGLEIYNLQQDQWSQGVPLPNPVSAYAMVAFEGKLYLFGGWDGHQYLSTVLVFDPGKDEWEEKSPMPTPRAYAGAALAGGRIYIIGGYNGKEALDTIEIYSPNLDELSQAPWSQGAPLPQPRYAMGMTSLTDVIYLVGGRSSTSSGLPSLGFATQTGQWKEIGDPSDKSWSNLELITLGTRIHALGGVLNQEPTARNVAYQVIYITVLPFIK